mgnify:CR=1 FL=1
MKFIDEATKDDLAKSSTILQCILASLDFECGKYMIQPEVIGVEGNEAMVNVDALEFEQMVEVCNKVNTQFKRKDTKFTCIITNEVDGFISCIASELKDYIQLI